MTETIRPDLVCSVPVSRPGVLGGGMGNYPWLADSWPTSNLMHSGKDSVNCCTAKHDSAERYYNGEAPFPKREADPDVFSHLV